VQWKAEGHKTSPPASTDFTKPPKELIDPFSPFTRAETRGVFCIVVWCGIV
jgi:hypothetical protein